MWKSMVDVNTCEIGIGSQSSGTDSTSIGGGRTASRRLLIWCGGLRKRNYDSVGSQLV